MTDESPLGDRQPVEGAPLARVTARLTWGIERATVRDREGSTLVRTPDGPRTLRSILDELDRPYFPTRQAFETAVRDVIGTGPVPTTDADTGN